LSKFPHRVKIRFDENEKVKILVNISLRIVVKEPNHGVRKKELSYLPSNKAGGTLDRHRPLPRDQAVPDYALLTPISVLIWVSVRTKQKPELAVVQSYMFASACPIQHQGN
jgi:hypothetical protein